jgi:hypothetical protein
LDVVERRSVRLLLWIAAAVPLLMVAVYLSLIRSQGALSADVFTVPFVVVYMLAMAGMLVASLLLVNGAVGRATLRGGAAAGLITLGVFAAFSIGAPILLAGVIAAVGFGMSVGAVRPRRSALGAAVAALICVVVLLLGFDVVHRVIVCPPTSTEGGGGSGLILGPYQYQCENGEVHWSST